MYLMEALAAVAHVVAAHLSLDAARVEFAAAADAPASGEFVEQRVAPRRQSLRGERPRLAASFA